ncbi:DUF58 domain-containing protein [Oceanobacillus sp. Castelsardo]|uniref:DUF58 domain-containing protein n=1 Tax=Oceanobacillus sp. Castelsardo TaxID=1851204 RepID=UPI000837FCBB|nr:DUF58 domain-containing protein [Oceanobacillus sp. Castelsardo]
MKNSLKFLFNLFFVFILISILFSYAMFQGGFVSWFLFSGFLPIFVYHIGFLMYPIRNWQVSRSLSKKVVHAGESITVSINLKRNIPFPIYYCLVEEVFSHSLNRLDNGQRKYESMNQPNNLKRDRKVKKAVLPWFNRNIEITYTLDQIPRGKHSLQEIRVKTGDVFGFVKKEHIFQVEDELFVHPKPLSVRNLHFLSNSEQGKLASEANHSVVNTNIAVGVREYEPGDRFTWIDWKQTARKNTMMTKEFEQEKSSNILLALDSCNNPSLNPLAFEGSIELTLGLIEAFRKQHTRVNLITITGKKGNNYFTLNKEVGLRNRVIEHLTTLQPTGMESFGLLLKEQMLRMNNGDIVFVMTTYMDETFKQTIDQMSKRMKQVVVVFIQSSTLITESDRLTLHRFKREGIGTQIITEEKLVKKPIEVDIR